MRSTLLALGLLGAVVAGSAQAQPAAPSEIKIGALYASSGAYASISMPVFDGFKLWVDQTNANGGAEVKAFGKKIPIKLIAYDDQSSTATAATLYNQLITQDHVDLLIGGFRLGADVRGRADRQGAQAVPVRRVRDGGGVFHR